MARKSLGVVLLWLLAAALVGCQYLPGGKGYEVRVSQAQLQERLDKRFPRTKTYLYVFRVTLENPRVHLDNGSRRVGVALDFVVGLGLGGEGNRFAGSLDFTSGLSYAADTGDFYLTDPLIERLSIEGLPPRQTERLRAALSTAIAEHALTHPVYSLKETDIKQAAARLTLKKVVVDQGDLVLTMGL